MATYYKYRVRCTTDNVYEYWILSSNDSVPTTCPKNTFHTIDTAQTIIVDTIEENEVVIKEELTPTGGNFRCHSVLINAVKNTITSNTSYWPFPISALSLNFLTEEVHRGDTISATIGEDIVIGYISVDVSPSTEWVPQNYTVGQTVKYTDPVYGARIYTCITDTLSNDIPINISYWKHGLEISVNQTVIDNCGIGYYIKLDDGNNNNNVERIISVDKEYKKIYVEKNLTNSFLASTPTYIKQTIYLLKDYHLETPWEHNI